jgi:hypothetical protein
MIGFVNAPCRCDDNYHQDALMESRCIKLKDVEPKHSIRNLDYCHSSIPALNRSCAKPCTYADSANFQHVLPFTLGQCGETGHDLPTNLCFGRQLVFETRRLGQSIIFRCEVTAKPRIRGSDWKQASKPEDRNIYRYSVTHGQKANAANPP